jgi:hypothetical protein
LFYFLQPVWMFAAAGIIIPIAVHLWNVRRGKVLKVGSVALLTAQAVKNTSSIKLNELLLLLLRCLLILLLAALLAKPQWAPTGRAKEKGWLLIPKQQFSQTYNHFKQAADSLLQAGYQLHHFDEGFKQVGITDALNTQPDTAGLPANYWHTIKLLNAQVDTTLPVYIFTGNRLVHFAGSRPGVSLNLQWYTYTNVDTPQPVLITAYKTFTGGVRVITANSSADGIYNTYADTNSVVKADTAAMYITVYSGENAGDAKYVVSAIEAIKQFSKRDLKLIVTNNIAGVLPVQDWLFWLSEKPVPPDIAAKNIFRYVAGKAAGNTTWLTANDEYAANNGGVMLYKSFTGADTAGKLVQAIWQDAFGDTVLTKEEGKTNVFQFYCRFSPAWGDLPWSGTFPQLLYKLIMPGDTAAMPGDNRMIDAKQLQPYMAVQNSIKITKQPVDMQNICWLIIAAVFFAERVLVYFNKKARANAG